MSNQMGSYLAVIKVVGIGGGGTNAVTRMVEAGLSGVEFVAVNTDAQALLMTEADEKIHIGSSATRGSAPARTRVGRAAAEESRDELKEALEGRGHGLRHRRRRRWHRHRRRAGRCADRTRARRAHGRRRDEAVRLRGKLRADQAEQGIQSLRENVDTLIVIENDRLLQVVERDDAHDRGVPHGRRHPPPGRAGHHRSHHRPRASSISTSRTCARSCERRAPRSWASGPHEATNRAVEAAQAAISSPLLETTLDGATGVLLNITGGPDLGLAEVDEAAQVVTNAADSNANVIFGAVIDEAMGEDVRVTAIATGFGGRPRRRRAETPVAAGLERARSSFLRRAERARRRARHPVVLARGVRLTLRKTGIRMCGSRWREDP